MADEILRSRHAFGNLEGVADALSNGLIDAFDVVFIDGDTIPKIGWIDRNMNFRLVDTECVVNVEGDTLPTIGITGKIYIFNNQAYVWNGEKLVNLCTPTDVTELEAKLGTLESRVIDLEAEVRALKAYADEKATNVLDKSKHLFEKVKYEITDTPVGTIVDYREEEIRVMCPANAEFVKQAVGVGGDANSYYMTFKTYAPNDDVVGYIEHLGNQVDSEILTDLKTDEYGRKYQPSWLALAKYDDETGAWNYYGASSSKEKYIGWDYRIDWYNADGLMVSSDSIRINLSNEDCHFEIKPYYVPSMINDAVATANAYTDKQIEEKISIAFEIVEF